MSAKLLTALMLVSSMAYANNLKLTCEIEDYDERDTKIEMIGVEKDGAIHFEATRDNLETYYIPDRVTTHTAQWHMDGKVEIKAKLEGDLLTYTYKFHNYLRDRDHYGVIFDETRALELDMEEVADSYEYFDGGDGELLEDNTNQDDWINRRGITLDDCKLEFDRPEIEDETEPKKESRFRRFLRRIFKK
jgi:hypothetical protein